MPLKSIPFADAIKFTRASDAYIYNNLGLFTKVERDLPRFNYDPITKALQGILIEEGRTNLIPNSNAANTLPFPSRATYVEQGGQKFVDGTSVMRILKEDNTAANSHFAQPAGSTMVANGFYTGSYYVKAAGRTKLELNVINTNGWIPAGPKASFDLTLGTVTPSNGATGTIEKISADIWRISMTAKVGAAAITSAFYPILLNDAGATIYDGDGVSGIFIGGAQVEQGEFPTSHIPTTGAQVTRSYDNARVDGIKNWLANSAFSFYADFTPQRIGVGGTNLSFYARAQSNASNSLIAIRRDGGAKNVTAITSAPTGLVSSATDPNSTVDFARIKVAMAVDKDGISMSANGRAVVRTPAGEIERPTPDFMTIGQTGSNSQCTNGHIRVITHYARKLTDAELQGLTA